MKLMKGVDSLGIIHVPILRGNLHKSHPVCFTVKRLVRGVFWVGLEAVDDSLAL